MHPWGHEEPIDHAIRLGSPPEGCKLWVELVAQVPGKRRTSSRRDMASVLASHVPNQPTKPPRSGEIPDALTDCLTD